MLLPEPVAQTLRVVKLDFEPRHRHPKAVAVVVATVVSIVGSLLADAILVVIGEAIFPATKGYVHFAFSDYSKLTVVGVVLACIAWPVVTRMTSAPRWVFARMAVLVSAVLLLPDVALLVQGQPVDAVVVLMVMHLAIGLVTYNALVRLAPVRSARPRRSPRDQTVPAL